MNQSLRLRKISEGDLVRLFAWRNDPLVFQWCKQYEPRSWPDHRAWFENQQTSQSSKMYIIEQTSPGLISGSLIGLCGLTDIDWINSRAEFNILIGPENQRKGFGFAGLRLLLSHGFNVLNLHSIWGQVFDDNPALKLFFKVGFQHDGKLRNFYFRNGKYINAQLISITRDEFNVVSSIDSIAR